MDSLLKLTRVDLKGVRQELKRIADALDFIILKTYDYHMKPPPKVDTSGDEPEVLYSSDEKSWADEMREAAGQMKPPPEDEDSD